MKKTKLLLFILILNTVSGTALMAGETEGILSEGKVYSLPDLYRIALRQSEKIRIYRESLFIAERNREKADSVLKPTFSAFGEFTKYSEKKDYDGIVAQADRTGTWGFRLSQSFNLKGREFLALKVAEQDIEKNRHDLHAIKEDYLFSVASGYYDVLKLMKAVEIAEANAERLKKHREAVSIRLKLEEVTKTALYRTEAELSQAAAELISSKNSLKLAEAVLASVAGLPRVYQIRGPGVKKSFFFKKNMDALKKEALDNRAELSALRLQDKMAGDGVEIAKSEFWPTFVAEGVYLKMDQAPSSPYKDSLSAVIRFDLPLYDWGLRQADIEASLSRKRQAKLAVDALSKQISVEIEQVYLELMTHQGIMKSLTDQLEYARQNYNAVSKQFKYGLADSVEVMDANTLLLTSQKQISDSRYSFQLAMLKLKRMKGIFLKEILESIGGDAE